MLVTDLWETAVNECNWPSKRSTGAIRIWLLLLAGTALIFSVSCQHTSTVIVPPPPKTDNYIQEAPFLICGVTPGTKIMVPSCGPDPVHNPVHPACANPDGTFLIDPGASVQFGILNSNGIKCDVARVR